MTKETKQKIGFMLHVIIGLGSYFLVLHFVHSPMIKYGYAFIYFGPIKTIKNNIYTENIRLDGYKFSHSNEIKKGNVFTKIYTVFITILTIVIIWFLMLLIIHFLFYVLYIDIGRLMYTGEWKRGEKMTTWKDYEDIK
jgi:hypothetical protein